MKSTIFTIFKLIPNWTFAFVNAQNCTTFFCPRGGVAHVLYIQFHSMYFYSIYDIGSHCHSYYLVHFIFTTLLLFSHDIERFFSCEICSHSTEHIFSGLLFLSLAVFFWLFAFVQLKKHVYSSLFESINHWFCLFWLCWRCVRWLCKYTQKEPCGRLMNFFLLSQYLHFFGWIFGPMFV